MQMAIYFGLLILISLILFSSYLCCHHACRVDQSIKSEFEVVYLIFLLVERTTIRRMRRVQNWLQSKPSMWIHNLTAAEKVFVTNFTVFFS
jgi:hypothetical protein